MSEWKSDIVRGGGEVDALRMGGADGAGAGRVGLREGTKGGCVDESVPGGDRCRLREEGVGEGRDDEGRMIWPANTMGQARENAFCEPACQGVIVGHFDGGVNGGGISHKCAVWCDCQGGTTVELGMGVRLRQRVLRANEGRIH